MFSSLNKNQYKALKSPRHLVLQILAGPGTGKTKVITSRVAYLLLHYKLPPEQIIVTTFTKKAANEMMERLRILLGDISEINLNKLFIGTFHSICVRILRVYGKKIQLNTNFKIADESDSKQLLKKALGSLELDGINITDKEVKKFKNFISCCKAKAKLPSDITKNDFKEKGFRTNFLVYEKYQESLINNNLIDFDDCLLLTYKLLKKHPYCLKNIKHVLVDEFQDTNLVQLNLMYLFSQNCDDNVTVVGDPDQSIYGFRHAEADNFLKMEDYYIKKGYNVEKIKLDQNYRSTSNILNIAEAVMNLQSTPRDSKELHTNKAINPPVYFNKFPTNKIEANQIALDISSLVKNGSYKYSDTSIIIRSAFLSRVIEQELIHKNIPYVIVHGHSFWELKEIKMMVDCLRVIASDHDWLGYSRTMEWYVKGLGPKVINAIEKLILEDKEKDTLKGGNVYKILQNIVNVDGQGLRLGIREGIKIFLEQVDNAKKTLKDKDIDGVYNCLCKSLKLVEIVTQKKSKNGNDSDVQEEVRKNLEELKMQLLSFNPREETLLMEAQNERDESNLDGVEGGEEDEEESDPTIEFLSQFLDSIYLYEATHHRQSKSADENLGTVTITTIHGAKGLEWPVVFIPALCDGILPSQHVLKLEDSKEKTSQLDEERRCLYVAMTRAKDKLYLSSFAENQSFGFGNNTINKTSSFITSIPKTLYQVRPNLASLGFSSLNISKIDYSQYKSKNAKSIQKFDNQFSHIPAATPVLYPKKRDSKLMEDADIDKNREGVYMNPVTGAMMKDGKPLKKKKKRLGANRPLRSFLPNKK